MPEEIEVPTEHLHEKMEEEAHHGGKWISRVAVSSALLAVLAAISALYAGGYANEAILEEMKATDQWALFQAKGIKRELVESKIHTLESLDKPKNPKDDEELKRYDEDKEKTKEAADEFEHESARHMASHEWFARAVTLFQIAIALGAISVLAKRPKLWSLSLVGGVIGAVFLALGFL